MAIEGSLVLPCFLFFMMTVLLSLEAVRFQSDMMEALHQTGNKIAAQAYQVKYIDAVKVNAEVQVKEYLSRQFLPYLCVEGKENGILVQDVSMCQSGKIEITTQYKLTSVIWWLPIGNIVMKDRFLGHAWTGYSGLEGQWIDREPEIYVYITKTGTKYHTSADCSYLKVQARAVDISWIEEGRNKWGGKYTACKRCDAKDAGMVYVTNDGSSYHSHGDCSALKRTVYLVPVSEAEGYSACSGCGG